MGLRLAKITRRAEMGPSELTLVSIPFTTNGDARRLNKHIVILYTEATCIY